MEKHQKMDLTSLLILNHMSQTKRSRLNIKDLATKAGVSRAWVYKNFGSSEQMIVNRAIDAISQQFTELSNSDDAVSTKEWLKQLEKDFEVTLMEVDTYPGAFRFLIQSKITHDEYCERFEFHEKNFIERRMAPRLRRMLNISSDMARAYAHALYALRLGLIVQWLADPNRTAEKKRRLTKQFRKLAFLSSSSNY